MITQHALLYFPPFSAYGYAAKDFLTPRSSKRRDIIPLTPCCVLSISDYILTQCKQISLVSGKEIKSGMRAGLCGTEKGIKEDTKAGMYGQEKTKGARLAACPGYLR